MKIVGDKEEVYRGLAKHTAGGLTKKDLKVNKQGKVVSARKSAVAKKQDNLGLKGSGMRKKRVAGKGSGIFSGILSSMGLGVPASRGGKRARPRKQRGKGMLGDLIDREMAGVSRLTGLMDPAKVVAAMGKGIPVSRGGKRKVRKSKGKGSSLFGMSKAKSKGKGVPASRGGKRGRPRKQRGKGGFEDFVNGFTSGLSNTVNIGSKLLPFIL